MDLQALLDEAAARHGDVAGAAVAVGARGQLLEAATGLVNRNTGVEATPDSLFQIGSVTKVLTAVLVMQLVDDGLVDLDAPVRRYLPEFAVADREVTETVTVRQLLSHTGGFAGDLFEDTGRGDDALDRLVARLHDAAQVHPPGAMFSYCNAGFNVLGALAARLRGGTWESALSKHVLTPLGATHAALLAEDAILFRVAAGHVTMPGADRATVVSQWQMPRSNGPAGATTCAAPRDLIRLGRMFLAGGTAADGTRVLSAESARAMLSPRVGVPGPPGVSRPRHWGLGVALFEWDSRPVYGHDGDTPGQATIWRVVPDRDLVLALSVTGPGMVVLYEHVVRPVLRELAGLDAPTPAVPPEQPRSPGDLSRYLGRYAGPLLAYEVAEATGGLDVTLIPGEFFTQFGEERRTDRFVRLSGDSFVSVESEGGRHEVITFIEDGRYLHNGRAVPRVDGRP